MKPFRVKYFYYFLIFYYYYFYYYKISIIIYILLLFTFFIIIITQNKTKFGQPKEMTNKHIIALRKMTRRAPTPIVAGGHKKS